MATQKTPPATPARIHASDGIARRAESNSLSATQRTAPTSSLVDRLTGARRTNQSLDRDQRIRRASDFLALRHSGVSRAHPLLVLRAVPNNLNRTRFGFVVSKRISVKAVDRNRVRRRLRDIVRRAPVREGWDQLLIARKPIVGADFQTIRSAVLDLERRLDLLETPSHGKCGE